jgi:hypothetical protein
VYCLSFVKNKVAHNWYCRSLSLFYFVLVVLTNEVTILNRHNPPQQHIPKMVCLCCILLFRRQVVFFVFSCCGRLVPIADAYTCILHHDARPSDYDHKTNTTSNADRSTACFARPKLVPCITEKRQRRVERLSVAFTCSGR